MAQAKIGIIGGSGLYKMDALKDVKEVKIDTPFGAPYLGWYAGSISGKTWPQPYFFTIRSALPGKYLCNEESGS